jgi:hypothetical protein
MNYYENILQKTEKIGVSNIIANDIDSWTNDRNLKKNNRKIYNKLWLIEKQNIDCGPIGTSPKNYPIIIKPIINLYGMSRGFKKIDSTKEYYENQLDGFFWMPYYNGKQYTIDLILDNGQIIGIYALESIPNINGTFKYHVYRPNYILSKNKKDFIENNFKDYSGPMNIEIIDDVIIEGHLRFNGDLYLYDLDFLKTVSLLIERKEYDKSKLSINIDQLYLFPYFVFNNFDIKILDKKQIEDILLMNGIDNIRWDNIKSDYQRNDLCRLLMFKTENYELGNKMIKLIEKNLIIREHLFKIY